MNRGQLTGALSHVLPIMICVMTSKWVGDAMGKDGIYSVWIAMRRYPWLPPVDYRDRGETGANLLKPLSQVVVIEDGVTTVGELKRLLAKHEFHGFPVIDKHREFVGFATKQELRAALGKNCYRASCFILTLISFVLKNACRLRNQISRGTKNAPFRKTGCD